jgi:fatty-acyl-CoA synthase
MNAAEDELLDHMRDNLASFKVPKRVEFLERLPISGAGKILKRELKEQMRGNKQGADPKGRP